MTEEKELENKIDVNQEQTVEEKEQIVDESKKKSFWNKLGSGIRNTAKKAGDGIKAGIDKVHDWNEERKAVKRATETFEIVGDGTRVKMFRKIEEKSLYFKQDDKNANKLKSKIILLNTEDNSEIQLLEIDRKTTYFVDLKIEENNKESRIEKVPCFKATYKNYKKEVIPINQTINNNQSVVIEQGAVLNGDIVQNNYVEKLNEIELAINSYKPKFFNKSKKEEAIKMFGNFKNCIIKQQKDESLFSKFLKIISDIAPSVVSIVVALISGIK